MDLVWTILACLCLLAGLAGCFLPLLPGPPLCYVGMLLLQFPTEPLFSTTSLLIWLLIVVVVQILDYIMPLCGTRTFGGTRYGIWGSAIGMIIGLWFGLPGLVAGPFIGALVGEVLFAGYSAVALKAALGSFIGFVFSTLLKIVVCIFMIVYSVMAMWEGNRPG